MAGQTEAEGPMRRGRNSLESDDIRSHFNIEMKNTDKGR